ncbi:hypothetical protein DCC79_14330 [bacterium]|nr:hypothetical protein [Chloroflexi bacterium CFX6]RIL08154.1 MAG: hypothetical protein DCC79_14330 [bacterium]
MSSTTERIIRVLLDEARCTECGSAYHAEDVHVLRQVDERMWDLAVVCNGCYTLSLIRAIVKPNAAGVPAGRAPVVPEVELVTELTRAERRYFSDLPPVEVDDVLDMSAFLAEFDGDFRDLFGQDPVDPAHD